VTGRGQGGGEQGGQKGGGGREGMPEICKVIQKGSLCQGGTTT